jgi:hypothetical protein
MYQFKKQQRDQQSLKRQRRLQKDYNDKTLAFLKLREECNRKLEDLQILEVQLNEAKNGHVEVDEGVDEGDGFLDFHWFQDNEEGRFDHTENLESDGSIKRFQLPEMEMEPQPKPAKRNRPSRPNYKKPSPDSLTLFLENNVDVADMIARKIQLDKILTIEAVEKNLQKLEFYFPCNPILYGNGIAFDNGPSARTSQEKFDSTKGFRIKFNLVLNQIIEPVRRRSFVFGENPKTKQSLSMRGAYVLLDETKKIVGYEFDSNFKGEPESGLIWDYYGLENGLENCSSVEKPGKYLTEKIVEQLLEQNYVFFPSRPMTNVMASPTIRKFNSKIRDDGLIKVEDLIPEDGNQSYIFSKPDVIRQRTSIQFWDETRLIDTSVSYFKIVQGLRERGTVRNIIGYRIVMV